MAFQTFPLSLSASLSSGSEGLSCVQDHLADEPRVREGNAPGFPSGKVRRRIFSSLKGPPPWSYGIKGVVPLLRGIEMEPRNTSGSISGTTSRPTQGDSTGLQHKWMLMSIYGGTLGILMRLLLSPPRTICSSPRFPLHSKKQSFPNFRNSSRFDS